MNQETAQSATASLEMLINRLSRELIISVNSPTDSRKRYMLMTTAVGFRLLSYFNNFCITRSGERVLSMHDMGIVLARACLEPSLFLRGKDETN